ncbi:hypothetical protein [Paraburkholderia sp. Ac-20340]|uniref:hypothetical protein n=1 Tax=Paraburkholderia sp. Ac-20340 TaxID=2703888 RepID=UPI001F11E267|nr:hypothetical protein [Paraburkholderia sp. Ac-20340]
MSLSAEGISQFFKRLNERRLSWQFSLRRYLFSRLSFSMVERAALAAWLLRSTYCGRVRAIGVARYETGRVEVGLTRKHALQTMSAHIRELWFDERFYAGRALKRDGWNDLLEVARQLAGIISQMRASDPRRPIVLSPFHYISQYANIYVIDEVRRELNLDSISVVSGVPRDIYGNDAAMIPSIRVLYTYDEDGKDSRNGLGLRVIRSLRRDGVAVVFSDVPPFALAKFPMETTGVTIGGRPARLHNGVFRLGAPLDAWLLSFYLRFENGRFSVRVFEPIALARADAPQSVANDIEAARKENYPHWLYAGHPSVYHFAATR